MTTTFGTAPGKKPKAKGAAKVHTAKSKGQFAVFWLMFRRNKLAVVGLVIMVALVLCALTADFITPYYPNDQNLQGAFQWPSSDHWFGTDEFGRDIFTRVVYGSRQSLFVGLASVAISCVIGSLLGLIGGFYGGLIDNVVMRVSDTFMSIPSTLLAIAIVGSLGSSMRNLLMAIAIAQIPGFARIMRAAVLKVRSMEYIIAARVLGIPNRSIIMQDVLPNCLSPIIVNITLSVGFAILSCAGLSFLGLGIQPPTPEWGGMISTAKNYVRDYPYMTIFPGAAIMLTILALNFLGDGLRDALDPKMR
ncbi:ABC transporter permease [Bifidobacterium subtile]|uniref:ABC transporter permease n=1 Tax=Bifidobacterium subtile TaxID=77635 RepID=UPI0019D3FB30|nr:ABC transporter permease [Bifidobacterium subtile]